MSRKDREMQEILMEETKVETKLTHEEMFKGLS